MRAAPNYMDNFTACVHLFEAGIFIICFGILAIIAFALYIPTLGWSIELLRSLLEKLIGE